MPETSHGLRLQAAAAIAADAEMDRVLQVLIAKADDDDNVVVPLETLRSLRIRINSDALILQKFDRKVETLETELFKA